MDLSDNSLTGEIPRELGGLSNLRQVLLSGNSLAGCMPLALKDVTTNDLRWLNLLYCPPAPGAPTAGTPTKTSVPLSWTAVANTTKYRVEYRHRLSSDWTVDDDTLTGATHTVDGLYCEGEYRFQVRAYGNGTTNASAWSDPLWRNLSDHRGVRVPRVWRDLLRVSGHGGCGTGCGGGYRHGDGQRWQCAGVCNQGGERGRLFAIGESSGEVTVAADLSGEAGTTVTLTVVARNAMGAWRSVPVEVAITE